ncbi:unnamed protein product [Cuscuta epithymum]|uniref:F-box domain-containing protein n=1 Tax=Cuscuta epithymum TaxID=186058 RepID=A0AAV0G422_9ASTE|nr:unnamed protein product [Cuscuta epithymum]
MAAGLGKKMSRRRMRSKINGVFHDDVLVEVLQRAPPDSVARCKAVCKRWRDLISTPFFFDRFRGHHQLMSREVECVATRCSTAAHLFLFHPHFERLFSLDFLPFYEASINWKFVMGFCEGLLLLCDPRNIYHLFYYIVNPITKTWAGLPAAPPWVHRYLDVIVGFAYYPDLPRPRFKIVRILLPRKHRRASGFEVVTFCSETGKWAQGTVTFPEPIVWTCFMAFQHAVFYQGYLHWMDEEMRAILYDVENDKIACILNRPKEAALEAEGLFCFGLCSGRFYAAALHYATLRIWELKHQGHGRPEWTMQRQVHLQDGSSIKHGREWLPVISTLRLPLLAIHPLDINVVYIRIQNEVISCNLRTKTLKFFCKIPPPTKYNLTHSIMLPPWPTPIPQIFNSTDPGKVIDGA